jgi:hypothetical protein
MSESGVNFTFPLEKCSTYTFFPLEKCDNNTLFQRKIGKLPINSENYRHE